MPLAVMTYKGVTTPARSVVPSIYVASPLGFSESGRLFLSSQLVPLLVKLGYRVIDPWSLTDPSDIRAVQGLPYGVSQRAAWRQLNREIGKRNKEALRGADAVVAILDGVDVDSGTASEVGYAAALGKKIVGYRGDFRLSSDDEGGTVNIQVQYFIEDSGGRIVSTLKDLPTALDEIRHRNDR